MIIIKAEVTDFSDYILKDEPYSFVRGTVVSCTESIYNEITLNQFSYWINKYNQAKELESGRDDVVTYEII